MGDPPTSTIARESTNGWMDGFAQIPSSPPPTSAPNPVGALRRLMRAAPAKIPERCELCKKVLAEDHAHLLQLDNRQLLCACPACELLLGGQNNPRYRGVPRRVRFWPNFVLADAQWRNLCIPINLAFLYYSASAQRVVAMYPSPAGATEASPAMDAWTELLADNPVLNTLEPDVEALLVNRVGSARDCYAVPIDQCYKLVGIIRAHWRGLAGGQEAWNRVNGFFESLKTLAVTEGDSVDARA